MESLVLKEIGIGFPQGKLTVVVGEVGSGQHSPPPPLPTHPHSHPSVSLSHSPSSLKLFIEQMNKSTIYFATKKKKQLCIMNINQSIYLFEIQKNRLLYVLY
jgi:hypothetical protein